MRIITCVYQRQQPSFPGVCLGGERGVHTYPLQLLAVTVAQLVLEHGEQIGDDVEALRQQADALVHLQVAADGLVDGFELGLDPEKLWRVEDRAVEVDVDAQDEQLADLHVDLRAAERDLARQGDLRGDILAGLYGGGDELLEEGCLGHGVWSACVSLKALRGGCLSRSTYLDALSKGVGY